VRSFGLSFGPIADFGISTPIFRLILHLQCAIHGHTSTSFQLSTVWPAVSCMRFAFVASVVPFVTHFLRSVSAFCAQIWAQMPDFRRKILTPPVFGSISEATDVQCRDLAAQRMVFQLSTVWPAGYEVRFAFSASEWKFLHTFGPSALSFQLSTVWPAVLTRELQFLPQRGNLCSVLGPSFWAKGQIVWPHRHFCVATLHFLPHSGKCAHFLGPVFGPSARFWAQFCGQSARLCGHSATFDMSPCIFCLRVEFLRTFWAQFLGPVPDFGRKFLAERPDCVASKALFAGHFAFSASEWNFYALFWAQCPILGLDFDSSRHFRRNLHLQCAICITSVR
jgi:hypothetical protein